MRIFFVNNHFCLPFFALCLAKGGEREWFFDMYDTCPLCNIAVLVSLDYLETESESNLQAEGKFNCQPFCAACYADLPWRLMHDLRLDFYWQNSSLAFPCLVACYYQKQIPHLVRQYKFHQSRFFAKPLGYCLALTYWRYRNYLEQLLLLPRASDVIVPDYVTYVPLHFLRLRERSYDQAELLAKEVADNLQLPFATLLVREHATKRQSSTGGRLQRLLNVKDAFGIRTEFDLYGKSVLLIDDVLSTGASLAAAARVLYEAGASAVLGLALASNLANKKVHLLAA